MGALTERGGSGDFMSDSDRAGNHVRRDDKNARGGEEGDQSERAVTRYGTERMKICEPAICLRMRSAGRTVKDKIRWCKSLRKLANV